MSEYIGPPSLRVEMKGLQTGAEDLSRLEKLDLESAGLPWPIYGSSPEKYENRMGLTRGFFSNLIQENAARGTDTTVLDVCADDSFHRFLDVSGVGMTLVDPRLYPKYQDKVRYLPFRTDQKIIEGSIFLDTTWQAVDRWLAMSNKDAFSTIVSSPAGGFCHLSPNPCIHRALLNEMWKRLDVENGVMVVEIPSLYLHVNSHVTTLLAWIRKLKSLDGVQVQCGDKMRGLVIQRQGSTIHSLPE